jgi:hypothetical protein
MYRRYTAAATVHIDDEDEDEEPPGDIALYGEWQTEPWSPPAAVNGIVPKNERGNVDLHGGAVQVEFTLPTALKAPVFNPWAYL